MHDLPPEPFTAAQQRQTRMDGGDDEDGSRREFCPEGPPVVQPHVEREIARALAENRNALVGAAAYRDLPLTGAFQATFPWYRQSFAFSDLGDPTKPTQGHIRYRPDAELFSLDENGKVLKVLKPDGMHANQEDLETDAALWASHFAYDSFNNHCTNHEHNCTETCVKYVKQKLEAKLSLRSSKVPSCRFWYFRVKKLNGKRVRRRGKPLVESPFVEESDDRSQHYRCQLKREHPLRSTSNDICQVTDRCNVDYQFLGCAPVHCSDDSGAFQPAPPMGLTGGKRLTKKTKPAPPMGLTGGKRLTKKTKITKKYRTGTCEKWLYGCNTKNVDAKLLLSFTCAFRKAYSMDFYITKYQGKMMESLTPLFLTMATGIHRLEQQEKEEAEKKQQEKEDAEKSAPALEEGILQEPTTESETKKRKPKMLAEDKTKDEAVQDEGPSIRQAQKKCKTKDEAYARARRVCIRLASMANRCYWLSTTEVTTHILTGGDALQSHHNMRLFTRTLQWAMQQCKRVLNKEATIEDMAMQQCNRVLNKEAPIEDMDQGQQSLDTATVQVRTLDDDQDGASQPAGSDDEDDAQIIEMNACTTSTNTSDDFAHRGPRLQTMPYYVYRMYVRRLPRRYAKANAQNLFAFEGHYAMASYYTQEVLLHHMSVPTIDGFQLPTWEQDPEQNSLLKSILFTPWHCQDPLTCGNCNRFAHMLSDNGASQSVATRDYKYTFARAWRLRSSEISVLAKRARCRCSASRKKLVLADTTLFATLKEPPQLIQEGDEIKTLLDRYTRRVLRRTMPLHATRKILAYSTSTVLGNECNSIICSWHEEQCTLAEFCSHIAQDVLSHMELAAGARTIKSTATTFVDGVADMYIAGSFVYRSSVSEIGKFM